MITAIGYILIGISILFTMFAFVALFETTTQSVKDEKYDQKVEFFKKHYRRFGLISIISYIIIAMYGIMFLVW